MEITQILDALERNTGTFPRQAVEAAVEAREEITPALLWILEDIRPARLNRPFAPRTKRHLPSMPRRQAPRRSKKKATWRQLHEFTPLDV